MGESESFVLSYTLAMALQKLGGRLCCTKQEMDALVLLGEQHAGENMFRLDFNETDLTIELLLK